MPLSSNCGNGGTKDGHIPCVLNGAYHGLLRETIWVVLKGFVLLIWLQLNCHHCAACELSRSWIRRLIAMRVLLFLASALTACAFVQPAPQPRSAVHSASAEFARVETQKTVTTETSGFALALGASVGYAAAMMGAARGSMMRRAENQPPAAVARTPVAYPIFTFRQITVVDG